MEEITGYRFRKITGPWSRLDALVEDGEGRLLAKAEFKHRHCASTDFGALILSKRKVQHGLRLCGDFCRFLLVVRWADAIGWHWVAPLRSYEVRLAGRTDRGEEGVGDVEPCVHIPVSEFRLHKTERLFGD